MKVIPTDGLVVKSWCEAPEDGCINQAKNLAMLPFAFKHICLMPDTHQGYGMPIGGVLATHGVVIPNAVGVDIGCGMSAVKTSIKVEDMTTDKLKTIMGKIRDLVPVGFNHNKTASNKMPDISIDGMEVVEKQYKSATMQIGSLGGGNHFIEIQKGSDGHIWVMIHSGSRNLGKQVADHHNKVAKDINKKWYSSVLESAELAFLPCDTKEANAYIAEMNYCLAFSTMNRDIMMERIISCFPIMDVVDSYNIQHNYARWENHFGQNVMMHRKGATSAKAGEFGIIPGSQGTSSYIVVGKGNEDSFMSCSHGAGRKMGRKEAERKLNLEEEISKLNSQGVIHAIRGKGDLDEAAGAYKDINTVMNEQKDLVDIFVELKPMGVIKA
jgi:tRNA-splicing ligase RtcB